MFDLGADEILFTAAVAIVVIGPKELPRALRLAGRWVGKFRRYSNAFRSGIETMIQQAEIQDLEQNWSAGRDKVLESYAEAERRTKLDAGEPSASPGSAERQSRAPDPPESNSP